jgi:hypothetical protein
MEVLVALGIFAMGLVAVAAVFPTAIAIQRETVRDLAGQRVAVNAKSLVQSMARSIDNLEDLSTVSGTNLTLTYHHDAQEVNREGTLKPFTVTTLPAGGKTGRAGRAQPMIDQPINNSTWQMANPTGEMVGPLLNAARSFHNLFSEEARSYPKTIANSAERDYYWYPIIQPKDLTSPQPAWMMYLMIMQRHGTEAIPEVRALLISIDPANPKKLTFLNAGTYSLDNDANDNGLPDVIQPGDTVLGDDGSILHVVLAEKGSITVDAVVSPTTTGMIYYAQALEGGTGAEKTESRSPIVRIEQFELVVNDPDETYP